MGRRAAFAIRNVADRGGKSSREVRAGILSTGPNAARDLGGKRRRTTPATKITRQLAGKPRQNAADVPALRRGVSSRRGPRGAAAGDTQTRGIIVVCGCVNPAKIWLDFTAAANRAPPSNPRGAREELRWSLLNPN